MRRRDLAVVAALVVTGACSTGSGDADGGPGSATIRTLPPAATDPAATNPTTTNPAATNPAATNPTTTNPAGSTDGTASVPSGATPTAPGTVPATTPRVGDPVVAAEPVGRFDRPVDLAVRRGDDALWIVEQPGRVVRFDGADRRVALDLSDRVSTRNEQGLLGLAFSPDGARAYTNHTDAAGRTILSEFSVDAAGTFDPAGERTVLAVDQPYSNHNAGDLEFGPDGMLYVPLGDGGSSGDPRRNGPDPGTLLGSLLRIDPTPTADAPYTIPPDNPFAQGGDVDGLPEVWAWGLRNPWKIAFDPVTGDLWIPDVGQNQYEEINLVRPTGDVPAGFAADFGWSAFEGDARFNADVVDRGADVTRPVLVYDHDDGCSISGGAVYRGTAIPELSPAFVYSDFCAGTVWALDLAGARNLALVDGLEGVTAVRTGADGELYVLQHGGDVLRLVAG